MLKLLKVLLLLVHLVNTAEVTDEAEDTNPAGSCSRDGPSEGCDSDPKKGGADGEEEEEYHIDRSDMYKNTVVETLNDENFEEKVLKSDHVWLIKLYSPACGHCKAMHGEWVKAAKQLKGVIKFGAINDLVAYDLSTNVFKSRSVPKILYYSKGASNSSDYSVYNGPRDSASFVKHALDSLYEDYEPMMK
jgi:thioredoxin-like negative regulator of GroEL